MKHDSISILLPVYNAAPFLTTCLESIIHQSENDWELIAIDDFSTDDSFEILRQFAEKEHRIKVFKNTSKGIIPALRIAFEKSEGNLITRMDADDIMPENKLFLLKKILLENGKGYLATGLVKYFSEGELGNGYQKYEQWLNELSIANKNFEDIYKECVIPSPAWMCHREDLIASGGFENKLYPEDYDLCFRFYEKKLKVVAVDKVIHLWRDHSNRTSRTDKNYALQHYFDLKLPYFLKLDYDTNRPLVIWGAGKKGKQIVKMLLENNLAVTWVSNNEKKNGKDIYGILIENFEKIKALKNPQIIITVAAPDGKIEIISFLEKNGFEKIKDYFFFC